VSSGKAVAEYFTEFIPAIIVFFDCDQFAKKILVQISEISIFQMERVLIFLLRRSLSANE